MWSDPEYLSMYLRKLKNYPDTKDNILIRTSPDETPEALFVETKWMLLAPNVCLAFLLDSFPLPHSDPQPFHWQSHSVLLQALNMDVNVCVSFLSFNYNQWEVSWCDARRGYKGVCGLGSCLRHGQNSPGSPWPAPSFGQHPEWTHTSRPEPASKQGVHSWSRSTPPSPAQPSPDQPAPSQCARMVWQEYRWFLLFVEFSLESHG